MRRTTSSMAATLMLGFLASACATVVAPSPTPMMSAAPSTQGPSTPPPIATTRPPSTGPSVAPEGGPIWLDAGDLIEARNATNAVLVGNGEVLVVGSDYLTSWLSACGASTDGSDSVEIGDPMTGVWERTTSLRSLRDDPALVPLADGRALLTGGAAGENVGWSSYSSTYVFDPGSRRWSRSGLMNTARTGTAAAVLLDGRVLVAGGLYLDRASPDVGRVLDGAEVWDPRSGAWSRTGHLAKRRWGASAVTLADGRVLIVGGVESRETAPAEHASAEVYDPATDRWGWAGRLAAARSGFALVALPDGGALVAGGFGGVGTGSMARLSTVERFDPASDTWSPAADLLAPVAGASAILLANGHVLLAGGSVRDAELIDVQANTFVSGLTADAMLFVPETGTWTNVIAMPGPRAGASAVLLADGSAVFVGGSSSEGSPAETPGCPIAEPQVVRFVPAW